MTSNHPYLIRALHEWIVDNGLTPYLMVNASMEGVQVPTEFVEDGKIVLNISTAAVADLELGNEWIMFNARFHGASMQVVIPAGAVLAIYAKENGQGMLFKEQSQDEAAAAPASPDDRPKQAKRPTLKIVK